MRVRMFGPVGSPQIEIWRKQFEARGILIDEFGTSGGLASRNNRSLLALVKVALKSRLDRRRTHATIVHSLGVHGLLALMGGTRGRVTVVPWGTEVVRASQSPLRSIVVRTLLSRSDAILVTSRAMATLLRANWPKQCARKLYVESWGIEVEAISKPRSPEALLSVRNRYGVRPREVLILSPRGVKSIYRHAAIVHAFGCARDRRPELRLLVTGHRSGADNRGDDVPGVRYIGWQSKAELADLFAAADAIVSAPTHDQRSTAVLEAIASGRTVLLSDIPAYREVRGDGAQVNILSEPLVPSLTEALLDIGPGQDVPDNIDWARRWESSERHFDVIIRIVVGGSRSLTNEQRAIS